jgi:polyhydroxyalkanoate synthesis regulator phasin
LAGGGVLLALAALLVFGSAAFAQTEDTTGTDFGQAFIDKLAGKLGLSSDDLEARMTEAQNEVIDDAVANGELSEEQADVMRERAANGGWFAFGPGGPGSGRHHGGFLNLDVVAETLGMTSDELGAELEAGATLSEVIAAHGSTVEAVVAALVADAQAELDAAVAAGRLTQEEADAKLAGLSERLTERIESGAPFGPGFGDCPADDATDDAEETETSSI